MCEKNLISSKRILLYTAGAAALGSLWALYENPCCQIFTPGYVPCYLLSESELEKNDLKLDRYLDQKRVIL